MTAPDPHPRDRAEIIALPPVIFAVFVVLGLVLGLSWRLPLPLGGLGLWLGGGVIAIALTNAGWAIRAMKRQRTEINPRRPTTAIVDTGPFRYTRNPLYLSLVLLFAGLSLGLESASMLMLALPLVIVLRQGVIMPEERYLTAKFGDDYRRYQTRVRRWL
ncbi:MAG: isoprenylcysteine carboxylmethyltransferase family protein [Rhodospirillaceae bacterium]